MATFNMFRKKSQEFDSSPFAAVNNRNKSKETFVVLSTVLLLLVVSFVALIVLYFGELNMRNTLQEESDRNVDILKACDRFNLPEVKNRFSGQVIAPQVHPNVTCAPCPPCHEYAQKPAPKVVNLRGVSKPVNGKKIADAQASLKRLMDSIDANSLRNDKIQNGLQKISRELVLLKFGSPPYIVEMSIKIPSRVAIASIQYEMAPLDLMPYSNLYFLTQISSGAWDGCSFMSHAPHILLADIVGAHCKQKMFAELPGIGKSLAFQEYSDEYTHEAHSLGFPGRCVCMIV